MMEEQWKEIEPYLVEGSFDKLREDAPEEIKKKYNEILREVQNGVEQWFDRIKDQLQW